MRSHVRVALFVFLLLAFAVFGQEPPAQLRTAAGRNPLPRPATAQPSPGEATGPETRLPVRRVVLYKSGIGYFEHVGRVRGAQEVTIDFTSAQLNDVLKSLTALDLGGGRVTGVGYNSDAPLARRLSALRLPLGAAASPAQFWKALRGARIEVRSAGSVFSGRLLNLETRTHVRNYVEIPVDELSLITDAGEYRTVELTPAISVRVLDRELAGEVGRYLDLISSTRAQDLRRMTIATTGAGERPLFVSYISEVPVWKTTYRLVLPSKPGAKPLLQGWAIVDNTVGEDWNNVELSLVAGAPQSFIQQLSQPYYSRRPVVALPEAAQLTPQTHQATLTSGPSALVGTVTDPSGAVVAGAKILVLDERGNQVAHTTSRADGTYEFAALPAGNYRMQFEKNGFQKLSVRNLELAPNTTANQLAQLSAGTVASTVEVTAHSLTVETTNSAVGGNRYLGTGRALGSGDGIGEYRARSGLGSGPGYATGAVPVPLPAAAREASITAAQTRELGDLFEYKPRERITIHKNQSAMVPIVNTEIGMEKISLWNPSYASPRPWRAIWLTNSSSLTLDGGTFNVIEEETFAGEGITEPIKPGEKRLLSYALDLGVQISSAYESDRQAVRRVRVSKGVMVAHSEERERKTYTIRNNDATARTVVIEHPVRAGWKLLPLSAGPVESSAAFHRFRATVEPRKTEQLVVLESRPIDTQYEISSVDEDRIALWVREKSITSEIETAFRQVIAKRQAVAQLDEQLQALEGERSEIFDDQQRLRENIKALKGSAEEKELIQRYTRQLNAQENRLEELRKLSEQITAQRVAAHVELDKTIQALAFDVTL